MLSVITEFIHHGIEMNRVARSAPFDISKHLIGFLHKLTHYRITKRIFELIEPLFKNHVESSRFAIISHQCAGSPWAYNIFVKCYQLPFGIYADVKRFYSNHRSSAVISFTVTSSPLCPGFLLSVLQIFPWQMLKYFFFRCP